MVGLAAERCGGAGGDDGGEVTVVWRTGSCDVPARPWPEEGGVCGLEISRLLGPDGGSGGARVARRPLIVAVAGAGTSAWPFAEPPPAGGGKSAEVGDADAWLFGSCPDQCALAPARGGVAASCAESGRADVLVFGATSAAANASLAGPSASAWKGQRQAWVLVSPGGSGGDAGGEADVLATPAIFPELFPQAGTAAADGCALCAAARAAVEERCAATGEEAPGLEASAPHVLVMVPQNGHRYAASGLLVVFRVFGFPLSSGTDADGARARAVVRVSRPRHATVELVVSSASGASRWVPAPGSGGVGAGWEEWAVPVEGLAAGPWEVRVVLVDRRRLVRSADHILFTVGV